MCRWPLGGMSTGTGSDSLNMSRHSHYTTLVSIADTTVHPFPLCIVTWEFSAVFLGLIAPNLNYMMHTCKPEELYSGIAFARGEMIQELAGF